MYKNIYAQSGKEIECHAQPTWLKSHHHNSLLTIQEVYTHDVMTKALYSQRGIYKEDSSGI